MIRNLYSILFIIFLSCSSNGDDSTEYPPEEIIPSNLTLTISIVGSDNDNPNGDGSGIIQCSANADDAITYGYRFGNIFKES